MTRGFEDPDVGKSVFSSQGDRLGTVGSVHDENRASVERDDDGEGLTESIKDLLGWDSEEDVGYVERDDVERWEDDGLYLRER